MYKLKKIILIMFLFPLFIYPQGYWKSIDSPTDKTLRTVAFLDSLNGWIAGDSCYIFKTTDGAQNWEQQYQNDEYDLYDLFFLDENFGWAVCVPIDPIAKTNALLLNTTDGGQTWEENLYPVDNIYMNSIFYFDSANGWMGGNSGNIVYTTNSGERWHLASIDTALYSHFDIYKIKFYNESYGVATGGHFDIVGMAWVSRDGGLNWQSEPVAPDIITDFHFYDSLHIMGITKEIESYGSGLVRTTDGGETWLEYLNFSFFGPAESMALRTDNEVWVTLSTSQTFIYSLDSGYTWNSYDAPDGSSILELQFVDSLHGFGVGEFGALIQFTTDSMTSVSDNFNFYNFNLYQNYPNPFNPESIIKFELAAPSFVNLTVYDILGNEVETLLNEIKPAGIHNAVFDAAKKNLSSGIYFYRINAGSYSEVKKMIYLK
jgi:photosystem II stability/assembly factor-like uncharacterized protein